MVTLDDLAGHFSRELWGGAYNLVFWAVLRNAESIGALARNQLRLVRAPGQSPRCTGEPQAPGRRAGRPLLVCLANRVSCRAARAARRGLDDAADPTSGSCGAFVTFETGLSPSVEIHVAPGGDDSGGDGSQANPYASVTRAVRGSLRAARSVSTPAPTRAVIFCSRSVGAPKRRSGSAASKARLGSVLAQTGSDRPSPSSCR